jgi:hypothetical protein
MPKRAASLRNIPYTVAVAVGAALFGTLTAGYFPLNTSDRGELLTFAGTVAFTAYFAAVAVRLRVQADDAGILVGGKQIRWRRIAKDQARAVTIATAQVGYGSKSSFPVVTLKDGKEQVELRLLTQRAAPRGTPREAQLIARARTIADWLDVPYTPPTRRR